MMSLGGDTMPSSFTPPTKSPPYMHTHNLDTLHAHTQHTRDDGVNATGPGGLVFFNSGSVRHVVRIWRMPARGQKGLPSVFLSLRTPTRLEGSGRPSSGSPNSPNQVKWRTTKNGNSRARLNWKLNTRHLFVLFVTWKAKPDCGVSQPASNPSSKCHRSFRNWSTEERARSSDSGLPSVHHLLSTENRRPHHTGSNHPAAFDAFSFWSHLQAT
ncbi:uncharacterized protein LOC144010033 isoform X2 [Festucalex cinctus]